MAVKRTTTSVRKLRISRRPATGGQNDVISTAEWFGTLIVLIVPIIGLVVYLIWAFGTEGNLNRRNYCRAALILMAISLVFGIIFSVVLGGIIGMATRGFGAFW